jgi:predicted HicB family RNase H-like nuclease
MTTVTKSLTIEPAAADELAAAAQSDGLSVSRLIALALEDAIEDGLDPYLEPLPAGSKTLAPRLDPELVAAAEAKAAEAGLSYSAFTRAALARYVADGEDTVELDAEEEDRIDEDLDENAESEYELADDEFEDEEPEPPELSRGQKIAALVVAGIGLLALLWFSEPRSARSST